MNIFADIHNLVLDSVAALGAVGKLPKDLDVARLAVEPPRVGGARAEGHGDMATNAAMVLAKQAGLNPPDLAVLLIEQLQQDERVEKAELAAPAFVNITLHRAIWAQIVPHILAAGLDYGTQPKAGKKVNIEYVSANPTGPLHVGHARGAVLGDVLARLLAKTGCEVVREYYVNDAGAQIEVLARSALMRMREALGETIDAIEEGLYPSDYLIPVGQALAEKYGAALLAQDETAQIKAARAVAVSMMLGLIRADLAALGVEHDLFVSEQDLYDAGAVDKAVATLREKGLVYEGILDPPKGEKKRDGGADEGDDNQPQLLFRASQFGDDSDRALQKSDGSWSYFAPDIAYHADKIERGFTRLIDVWGADHAGYVKRMQAAVAALTDGRADLQVKNCNLVKLKRGNVPVKMSKRSGEFITLREVVDEVGKEATRFMMLTRKSDAPLDFDFALVKEKNRDNPVFYVQYAHARICSVMRHAEIMWPQKITDETLRKADLTLLENATEVALMRQIAAYPRLLLAAAAAGEPHRLAFYLQDLASAFHMLWNLGKTAPESRFLLADDAPLSEARLALLRATAITIASGLNIMGIEAESEMR